MESVTARGQKVKATEAAGDNFVQRKKYHFLLTGKRGLASFPCF